MFKYIKKAKDLVDAASIEIYSYMMGDKVPIYTRFEHLNNNLLSGILPHKIIYIGGVSGHGKTYFVKQICDDFLDEDLNANAKDHALLITNWEMPVFNLVLRRLTQTLKRSIKKILFKEPTDREREEINFIMNQERSENIFYFEETVLPEEWGEDVEKFLKHCVSQGKKHVFVVIDHVALAKDPFNIQKQAIDKLNSIMNELKKKYPVTFLALTQLNRNIEERTDIKHLKPRRVDIFAADSSYQVADAVIIYHQPRKFGFDKYMVIAGLGARYCKYEHLKEHFVDDSLDRKVTNFKTEGRVFFHYLKIREESDETIDLHIAYLDGYNKEKQNTDKNSIVEPMDKYKGNDNLDDTDNELELWDDEDDPF